MAPGTLYNRGERLINTNHAGCWRKTHWRWDARVRLCTNAVALMDLRQQGDSWNNENKLPVDPHVASDNDTSPYWHGQRPGAMMTWVAASLAVVFV